MSTPIYVQDVTLRDGMHAVRHRLSPIDVKRIVVALDEAGVDAIEVAHGDGPGGLLGQLRTWFAHRLGMARSRRLRHQACHPDHPAAARRRNHPRPRTCLLARSSIGPRRHPLHRGRHLRSAHRGRAREIGMDVAGFLMLSHMAEPAELARQAKLMESYGAHCVYVTDSGGRLTMGDVAARVRAYRDVLGADTQIGIHAHENLSLSVANSLVAVENGAYRVDASLAGHGAGAGNCPIEAFIAAANLTNLKHGSDLFRLQDAADDIVRPLQDRPVRVDRETLTLGYAGVYSSFLRHAEAASHAHGVDVRDLVMECGRRHLVGGQEDMIIDIALTLAAEKQSQSA